MQRTSSHGQMKRNPAKYGMPVNLTSNAAFDEAAERRPVLSTLTQLATHGLVSHFSGPMPFPHAYCAMCCTCVIQACIGVISRFTLVLLHVVWVARVLHVCIRVVPDALNLNKLHAFQKLPMFFWSHIAVLVVQHLFKQVGMEEGGLVVAKVPGELMAHYYIKFRTMVALITAPSHASLPDLIMLLGAHQGCSYTVAHHLHMLRIPRPNLFCHSCSSQNPGTCYHCQLFCACCPSPVQ